MSLFVFSFFVLCLFVDFFCEKCGWGNVDILMDKAIFFVFYVFVSFLDGMWAAKSISALHTQRARLPNGTTSLPVMVLPPVRVLAVRQGWYKVCILIL